MSRGMQSKCLEISGGVLKSLAVTKNVQRCQEVSLGM